MHAMSLTGVLSFSWKFWRFAFKISYLSRAYEVTPLRDVVIPQSLAGRCTASSDRQICAKRTIPPSSQQHGAHARLGMQRIIMIKGRRARNDRGSRQPRDRGNRWGAPITGVCQCALRACCMRCRVFAPCTDRSSFGHWLERSLHPDLRSRWERPCRAKASPAQHNIQVPP